MIVQKDFLNKLKDFGLNSYESKLWTALLSRGVSTAGELSDIANVPRSRSYDVLESLERKGFIITKLGKPIKYIAVPPSEVLERVKKKIKDDSETQTRMLETLKGSEILDELNLLHNKGIEMVEPTELTGSIRGRSNILNHLESMIKGAQKSILLVTSEEGLVRKAEYLQSAFAKAKSRGVSITIMAPLAKKATLPMEALSKLATLKQIDDVKARYCIIDGKETLFMLLPDKGTHPTYDVGVWVNTPFFSKALHDVTTKALQGK